MGSFILGPITTSTDSYVTLNPEYGYAFPDTKDQVDHRTLSGRLFSYKFYKIKKFEIPESFVNSSNRSLINSWWNANIELGVFEDFPDIQSGWKVRITNKEEPYPQFERPYFLTQHRGSLLLETYSDPDEIVFSKEDENLSFTIESVITVGTETVIPNDTPWIGSEADKLYLQSGQFTSTLKTSEDVSGVDNVVRGISYDGTNTPWCGDEATKLYLQSGQFTSTIKDSEDVSGIDSVIRGMSYDGTDTPWCGDEANKLYLQSGQFTSTLKTSEDVSLVDAIPVGISYDGTNTPWIGNEANKLYLQSGQFTATLKTSEDINGVDAIPGDISYDGTDTPWCGSEADKLYLQSGQFTATIKDSEDVSGIDISPQGICTTRFDLRLGI